MGWDTTSPRLLLPAGVDAEPQGCDPSLLTKEPVLLPAVARGRTQEGPGGPAAGGGGAGRPRSYA